MARKHGLTTHGQYPPLYRVWDNMLRRCYNPNNPSYKNYGGRGIRVYESWRNSFISFSTDVAEIGKRPGPNWTLDRIDNNGNYEPGNIRWATRTIQQRNRRNILTEEDVKTIRELHIKGKTRRQRGNTAELAQRFGVTLRTIGDITSRKSWKDPSGR